MQDFIKCFRLERTTGAWVCESFAELDTVVGRIQIAPGTRFVPGTIFMGIDIVKCLEEEAARQRP